MYRHEGRVEKRTYLTYHNILQILYYQTLLLGVKSQPNPANGDCCLLLLLLCWWCWWCCILYHTDFNLYENLFLDNWYSFQLFKKYFMHFLVCGIRWIGFSFTKGIWFYMLWFVNCSSVFYFCISNANWNFLITCCLI